MKIVGVFALFCSLVLPMIAHDMGGYTKNYQRALRDGAKAKVTVKVISEIKEVITNANVRLFFRMTYGKSAGKIIRGMSNAEGIFSAEDRTTDIVFITVEKNGYYTSRTRHVAQSTEAGSLADGRWRPWNPTIAVLLKKVHKPVTMVLSYEHVQIKSFMEPTGFDLEKHDWVSPVGKGVRADVFIKFLDLGADVPYKGLALEFVGDKNGAYVKKKDNFSVLKSDYQASSKDIYERIITNTEGKRGPPHVLLGGDDYLVFRVRSKLDAEGKVLSAFYGKIYGPFDYFVAARDKIRLITFFNPEENDTNLEFDGVGYGDGSLFGR